MLDHREVAAGRLFGMKGRENLGTRWQELGLLLNTMGPHKSVVQWQKVWTDLKYKARRHAALFRADHLKTGNKPKNEPALNDMEKKILTIIGPETAEGYCVADSLPERQLLNSNGCERTSKSPGNSLQNCKLDRLKS
uniref:Regulatory protein zeste n=1 Tax=Timema bartmani TaxID=61472 RepID=A0A7R9FCT9_9NEOP|nr:unnamed protein product [Timema bartmani]